MPADKLLQTPHAAQEIDERLARVFGATFPDLAPDAIGTASTDTVEEWDSLQSVVLMTLLEEEFGLALSPLDLPELTSYDSVRNYLTASQTGS